MPRPLVVLWFGIVIAVGAFLAFGSVRVGAGNLIGRRMSVRKIWSRFVGFLVEEGSSAALVIAVSAAAIFALIVAAVVLWLAFALRDAPRDATPADANER